MTYANNPLYKEVFYSKVHDVRFYMPENEANYHISRHIEANRQNIFSAAGVTKEHLDVITQEMLRLCNAEKIDANLRTNMAVLVNNIRVRMKHPIDEDCALRMGAIWTFMEGEDPDSVHRVWIDKKIDMCKGSKPDPELYDFFLSMGVALTPSWSELPALSETMSDYLTRRAQMLRDVTPA